MTDFIQNHTLLFLAMTFVSYFLGVSLKDALVESLRRHRHHDRQKGTGGYSNGTQ